METTERKPCRKCLLRDLDRGEYFKTMYDYIENLDEEIKTSPEEYEKRLTLCKECDRLLDGMCGVCGCYVEMRAAVTKNCCPAVKKKW